jgi:uncharacterized membrane protein YGL010W
MSQQKGITANLREQLIFYGSYHNNIFNQIIHFIFVPTILWSVSVWLSYTPSLVSQQGNEHFLCRGMVLNGSFFLLLIPYSLYYVILDVVAGVTWCIFVGIPVWISSEIFQQYSPENAWIWALLLHIFSWIVQIGIGHMYYEQRKPALLDSLFQSLLLAPLFVWFELLFFLGYRRDLYNNISDAIAEQISMIEGENIEKKHGTNEEVLVDHDD